MRIAGRLCDCWLVMVSVGPQIGYNEREANATRKAVKEFVRTVFKLE